MKQEQLKQVKRAVESFFYKMRYNAAWHTLNARPEYAEFRNAVSAAIQKQIIHYAKANKLAAIIGVKKADGGPDEETLAERIMGDWLTLVTVMAIADFEDYLRGTAGAAGQIAVDKIQLEAQFKLMDKALTDAFTARATEAADMIDRTTRTWLAKTIRHGLDNELSPLEMVALLRQEAKQIADERADVIAEFETMRTLGIMEMEVYKRNGVKTKKLITARDEMVCTICMGNEEVGEIPIDTAFPSGHQAPPIHVRCRCILVPVTTGRDTNTLWLGN